MKEALFTEEQYGEGRIQECHEQMLRGNLTRFSGPPGKGEG
jgi:hypothetical protein